MHVQATKCAATCALQAIKEQSGPTLIPGKPLLRASAIVNDVKVTGVSKSVDEVLVASVALSSSNYCSTMCASFVMVHLSVLHSVMCNSFVNLASARMFSAEAVYLD